MAGEQSELMRSFLQGEAGSKSEQTARTLTCLRILRHDTEAFDEFMAACMRLYAQCVKIVTNEINKEK